MPVMDGLEATHTIREEIRSAIPIIALTANAVKGEMEKCIQAGMNDYLSKPFEEEDLIRLIAKWLCREISFTEAKESMPVADNALYDLGKLKQITRGDEKFISKMLQVFIQETVGSLGQLDQAYEAKDMKKVKFLAHRMKSSLANLSVVSASNIAKQIETTEWAEEDYPLLEKLMNEFRNIIDKLIPMIQSECIQFTH